MKTILIVEDDILQQKVLSTGLRKYFNVILASDGKKGVNSAIKYIPDIIIMDIYLPEINGLDAIDIIKNNTLTSHIPVIVTSSEKNINNKALYTFIPKPYKINDLLNMINKFIPESTMLL